MGGDREWTIAVLGFGEAGGAIARGLAEAGGRVRGFDPAVSAPAGVTAAASDADACVGADLVISLTTAEQAEDALRQALPGLHGSADVRGPAGVAGAVGRAEVVYADANTASAGLKLRLAAIAEQAGVAFADIAIMAPVPGSGHRTPMLSSGPGAERTSAILRGYGATVDVLPGLPGDAATRKLLRSVFYKGTAAAVVEALTAAKAAGCEDWMREHIAAELAAMDGATAQRMEEGSYRHALRRSHEMAAAAELLSELSVPARVTLASQHQLKDFI